MLLTRRQLIACALAGALTYAGKAFGRRNEEELFPADGIAGWEVEITHIFDEYAQKVNHSIVKAYLHFEDGTKKEVAENDSRILELQGYRQHMFYMAGL